MATPANSLSFSFSHFYAKQRDLDLQGDATIKNNALQLTPLQQSKEGQALFSAPVHLWAGSTVASFETTFTFVISKTDQGHLGDGLTFFLTSADDTKIPPNSNGKYLGLFGPNGSRPGVVAVEFDTFPNPDVGDPDHPHIGIDVHSIKSVVTAPWNPQKGHVATAHIRYDPASKKLTVTTTYPGGNPVTLSHGVDLHTALPEWVRVGFSASTGAATQISSIHSWSFTSTLKHKPPVNEGN